VDDLLKVGGIFVSPIEVENALLSHDSVKECAVMGVEEEGLTKSLALVVLHTGVEGSEDLAAQLQDHVKDRLAPYKYPRRVAFVASLPKNDRGKLDRKALQASHGGGA
jgi:acyl-coenzyme A synthetase/AMP-(fatty) acid ligase